MNSVVTVLNCSLNIRIATAHGLTARHSSNITLQIPRIEKYNTHVQCTWTCTHVIGMVYLHIYFVTQEAVRRQNVGHTSHSNANYWLSCVKRTVIKLHFFPSANQGRSICQRITVSLFNGIEKRTVIWIHDVNSVMIKTAITAVWHDFPYYRIYNYNLLLLFLWVLETGEFDDNNSISNQISQMHYNQSKWIFIWFFLFAMILHRIIWFSNHRSA